VLGYSSANVFDRWAVLGADPLAGPFFRGLPSLLMGVLLVVKNRTFKQMIPGSSAYLGRRVLLPFVVAGALSTVGLFVYYQAMRIGGVIVTIPVLETYVIWGALIAWFVLGERVRPPALVGLLLIVAGLTALSLGLARGQPVSPQWYWAIPLALFTALTYGLAGVLWREGQLRGAHQSTAILLQFVTSLSVAVAGLALLGRLDLIWRTAARDVAALLASGVLSGVVGIYCLFTALRLMAVARAYAFSALTPIVATLFAHFFLDEHLNLAILLGVLLVAAGVLLAQLFRPSREQQA
jgi:drug/metabolite transporter (DMT)-like permease